MMQANERDLLKRQFDAQVHDESGGAESIEKIFDVRFSRRFTELINQTAGRNSRTGYISTGPDANILSVGNCRLGVVWFAAQC
jgi:hypothetical protein